MNQLNELHVNTCRYKTVVEHVFSPCVVDAMEVLDSEFDSELGRPVYPRLQLLGIFLFAEVRGESNLKKNK